MKKGMMLLTLAAALAFAGCGKEKETENGSGVDIEGIVEDVLEESQEGQEESQELTELETVASEFVQALSAGDYETAYGYLGLEDAQFVTQEDFEWYLPRGQYSDIAGSGAEIESVTSDGNKVESDVSVQAGPYDVSVPVALDEENQPYVAYEEFYLPDWEVSCKKGCAFEINGIPVDQSLITRVGEQSDVYKIPAIPNREITVKMTSSVFGEYETTLLPTKDYELSQFIPWVVNDPEQAQYFEQIRTMFNEMNATYVSGGTAVELAQYCASDADPQLAENLYTYFQAQYDSGEISDLTYSVIGPATTDYVDNKETFPMTVGTDNMLIVNAKVEKTWNDTGFDSGFKSTRVFDSFYVCLEDGQMKLHSFAHSDNFITQTNYFIQEW